MLHCSASSSAQWRGLGDRLAGEYVMRTPDFYGCGGREPWPGHKPLDLIDQARLAIATLPSDRARVHLAGHSFGGAVALRAALMLGDRLASLTLIEPSAFHLLRNQRPEDATLLQEIASVACAISRAVENGHYWAGMSLFMDYWGGAGTWEGLPHEAKIKLAQQARIVLTDFAALFGEPTPINHYRGISAPTLFLKGSKSPAPSRRLCDLLAAEMPNTRTVEISGAGHLLPFSHAEQVEDAIVAHLQHCHQRIGMAPVTAAA
jgi:pimeloyl-ACP methyl ester carboxylesterase